MINPSEISDILKQQLSDIESKVSFEEVGTVLEVGDGVAHVYGLENVEANELVEFENGVTGVAMNLEESNVGVILMDKVDSVAEGMKVRRTGEIASIPVGEGLLGRVINVLGEPLDGKGPIEGELVRLPLERKAPGEEITMFINSGGGQVGNGLALYDVMRQISSPVRTICMGHACSMAAVLFAAGDKREIYSHSKVMIHDPSISGRLTSKALELQALSEDLLATRQTIAEILSLHTGQTIEAILEKTCIDSYFNAEEAIEFGLADAVIENSK